MYLPSYLKAGNRAILDEIDIETEKWINLVYGSLTDRELEDLKREIAEGLEKKSADE